MRLIDANSVEYALLAIKDRESGVPQILAEWLAGVVSTAPTIDAVPVVRCAKCKWYNTEFGVCEFWHSSRHPEHYCGEGDPK